MPANDRQVGGDHYKGSAYEYWDFVHEAQLGYLAGTGGKYVARHRRAKGRQDIEKAIHYVDKCAEMHVAGAQSPHWRDHLDEFCNSSGVCYEDRIALFYICKGQWAEARACLEGLLTQTA